MRRTATIESPGLTVRAHYNFDPYSYLRGAGPLAYLVGDQLHPPMVDDENVWRDGTRWYYGAVLSTLEAARLLDLKPGNRILDVGCGIGGPARILIDNYGVHVCGVNISRVQLRTCERLNKMKIQWVEGMTLLQHDCQNPYPWEELDGAISINMLYHIKDKAAMLQNIVHTLRQGAGFVLEDWMLTPRATEQDREEMGFHFVSPYFAVDEEMIALIAQSGFRIQRVCDLGRIARTHLTNYFCPVFEHDFKEKIQAAYGKHGEDVVSGFQKAVCVSIRLYKEEKLTYLRLFATRD